MKILVIGAGSWGTAISNILADNKLEVKIWGRDKRVLESINNIHENVKYLKGFILNNKIKATDNLEDSILNSEIIVNAIPTQKIRNVFEPVSNLLKNKIIINTSKGIEKTSLMLIDDIFKDILEHRQFKIAYLSGPTFAIEVIKRLPTATTIASEDADLAKKCQKIFNNSYFRVYTQKDIKGVLLGGALKNVIAIGVGITDSLNLGHNARASLITRGLAEIIRLGIKLGANPQTFSGLAGLGDLVLTCTGDLSRNRKVGMELGKGNLLDEILKNLGMAAEGVDTSYCAFQLSEKYKVDMPIAREIYNIIYQGKSVMEAIKNLMSRKLKEEVC
jgi:glycerol-3-phosphate dehydrogenase (NAD(P)+)